MTTKAYEDMMQYYNDNPETNPELQSRMWSKTPWVVHVNEHDGLAAEWCRKNLGEEAYPFRDEAGCWFRGGAATEGWGLWGFAVEADMLHFCATFPERVRHAT